jgi:hypothetical protein
MSRKLKTLAILLAVGVMIVGGVYLTTIAQLTGVDSEEGAELASTVSTGLLIATGVAIVGLLLAVGLGSGKIARQFHSSRALTSLAVVALALILLGGTYLALRSNWKQGQEIELAMQRSPRDAADQMQTVMADREVRGALQTLSDDEFDELAHRVVATTPISAPMQAIVESVLASDGITPTMVITQPLLLLEEMRAKRDYTVSGEWVYERSLAFGASNELTLHYYRVADIVITNGEECHVPGGRVVFAVERVGPNFGGMAGGAGYLVSAVFVCQQ